MSLCERGRVRRSYEMLKLFPDLCYIRTKAVKLEEDFFLVIYIIYEYKRQVLFCFTLVVLFFFDQYSWLFKMEKHYKNDQL